MLVDMVSRARVSITLKQWDNGWPFTKPTIKMPKISKGNLQYLKTIIC